MSLIIKWAKEFEKYNDKMMYFYKFIRTLRQGYPLETFFSMAGNVNYHTLQGSSTRPEVFCHFCIIMLCHKQLKFLSLSQVIIKVCVDIAITLGW